MDDSARDVQGVVGRRAPATKRTGGRWRAYDRSVAELLTTVNELATNLDREVEAMGHGTGSMDAAVALWQQHETAYAVLQARLGASSRKVA